MILVTTPTGAIGSNVVRELLAAREHVRVIARDLSLDEQAVIIGEVLARPIRYEQRPAEVHQALLIQYGASESFARAIPEMAAAKDRGLDLSEPRTPENTTPTSFRQWCTEVLAPAVLGAR